jgi:outer membrane protein OmpA-like peptidoglycan-associated protein
MSSYHRILLGTKRFPNNRAPKPAASEDHWLVAYIKKNPFQSGVSLATLYGVLVIFAYHFHIEFFPSFDLKSLASTIFAAAYTALVFLVVFSLGLFAPAYVIGSWVLDEPVAETAKDHHTVQRRIIECFSVAFGIFLIVCFVFLLVAKYNASSWYVLLSLPIAAIICILGPGGLRWLGRWVKSKWHREKGKITKDNGDGQHGSGITLDKDLENPVPAPHATGAVEKPAAQPWKRIWFIFMMSFVAFMELLSMIILLYMLYDSPEAKAKSIEWNDISTLFRELALSGVILHLIGAYLVSAWRNPAMMTAHRGLSLAAVLAAPVFVSTVFGNPVLFFALTAMTTKYGNFRAAEMTLTNTGCRIVENGGEHLCVKQSDGTNKLCNVHVMSRIGTETYLLVSYPGKKSAAIKDAKGADPATLDAGKWVLDVYVPSKEILGSWVDTPVRHFDKKHIVATQGERPSVCAAAPPAVPVPPAPPAAPVPPKDDGGNVARFAPAKAVFEFDKYDLTPDGTKALQSFADGLAGKNATSMSIRVLGHADSIGRPYHNLQLSQMRAVTVRNYLHSHLDGVKGLNIDFNGAGPTQPLLADATCPGKGADERRVACLKPNRRVEVVATWTGGR